MRDLIRLVENMFKEPDWDQVVASMEREIKNSSADHATVRAEYGLDDPYDKSQDDTPEFHEFVKDWCHDKAGDAFYSISSKFNNGHIEAWRVITAPETWKVTDQHPGIYWAWDKNAADCHWGEFGNGQVKWRIHARIPETSVDWIATVIMNALLSYTEEREIRIYPDAPVEILDVERVK